MTKNQNCRIKVWFDFETFTEGFKHEPYLLCYIYKFNNEKIFTGENCAKEMLESLSYDSKRYKGIMLIAHNANYDCRFLLEHLYAEKALMKGRRFLNTDAVYYKQGGEKNWK